MYVHVYLHVHVLSRSQITECDMLDYVAVCLNHLSFLPLSVEEEQ